MSGTLDNKPATVDELSALFDDIKIGSNLDVEKSSDYGSTNIETLRPFDDKIADIKTVMKPEENLNSNGITAENPEGNDSALESVKKIELKAVPVSEIESKQIFVEKNANSFPKEEPQVVSSGFSDESNPLGLVGENFRAYGLIQSKYPQFQLYDGSHTFKDFYRYKVQSLKNLLARYGVLPLDDMRKEIENIQLDKSLGNDLADPVIIGKRMDDSIANRGRIATLLSKAQSQLPAWKKTFEWLNSKVWKDHESKGAHKRDSLALEHNSDMKDYYSALQGFVDSATTIDSFLKSQHDSYSRQLSCVEMREKVGTAHNSVSSDIELVFQETDTPQRRVVQVPKQQSAISSDSKLDGLDTLDLGTCIEKVSVGLVEKDFPGAEINSELLDGIG